MKTRTPSGHRQFELKLLGYGNCYYIDRVAELEKALSKEPRSLHIEMVGVGEILPDAALRIRSILLARSPRTQIITDARSSLHGSSVLVWLLGDTRLIREDAKLYFRRTNFSEAEAEKEKDAWNDEPEFSDSFSEVEPEEADYARVLQLINEFLPVKELAGRFIDVPVLRQFGLVENEKVDRFLAAAFGRNQEAGAQMSRERETKQSRVKAPAKRQK